MTTTRDKERFIFGLIIMGTLIIGMLLGYMLAMYGIFEIMNHIQIENMIIDLNETKMVQAGLDYMNRTGQI